MNVRKLGIHSQVAAAVGEDGLGLFWSTNCVMPELSRIWWNEYR